MLKKKNIILVVVIMLSTIYSICVFAGDIPESLMLGEQQALFIGKLIAIETNACTIQPLKVMMGTVSQKGLVVRKFNKYYGTNDSPKVGDFIVVVLQKENQIDDEWLFKATSSDYKTLKLKSEQYNIVKRYQEYINEGKYLEAQKKIDEKTHETESSVKPSTVIQADEYLMNSRTTTKIKFTFHKLPVLLISISIVVIISSMIILIFLRRR